MIEPASDAATYSVPDRAMPFKFWYPGREVFQLIPGIAVIVNDVFPYTVPDVAVIVVTPGATPVASPLPLTVATDVLNAVQVTVAVRSCDDPSE